MQEMPCAVQKMRWMSVAADVTWSCGWWRRNRPTGRTKPRRPTRIHNDLDPNNPVGKPEAADVALRTIAEMATLPRAELEQGVPARLRGVVTTLRPAACIQDGDLRIWCAAAPSIDGTFVAEADDGSMVPLEPGMLIEAQGVVMAGAYAPNLRARGLRILGKVPLPQPQPHAVGGLMRGGNNGARVAVGGQPKAIVQGQRVVQDELLLEVDIAGRRVLLHVPKRGLPGGPGGLVDAEIRAVGVIGSFRNNRGEFLKPSIQVLRSEDFSVTRAAPSTPFAAPRLPLHGLATYRPEPLDGHRVCVEGVVNHVGRKSVTGANYARMPGW